MIEETKLDSSLYSAPILLTRHLLIFVLYELEASLVSCLLVHGQIRLQDLRHLINFFWRTNCLDGFDHFLQLHYVLHVLTLQQLSQSINVKEILLEDIVDGKYKLNLLVCNGSLRHPMVAHEI